MDGSFSHAMSKLSPTFYEFLIRHFIQGIMSLMDNEYLPPILPCACGRSPKITTLRPEGRPRDVYRLVCDCGNCPLQWSVSKSSAIRLWNSFVSAD